MSNRGLKIALVHPTPPAQTVFERLGRSDLPPLGILYLGAVLLREGHSVSAYDLKFEQNIEALTQKIVATNPDVVGFSSLAESFPTVARLAKGLRERLPKTSRLIAGGPDVTCRYSLYQNVEWLDALFVGEAEKTLPEFARQFPNIPDIDGVAKTGAPKPSMPEKIDPNQTPFPARHLLPIKKYRGGPAYKGSRYSTSIFSHRGCPYHCTFCEKGVHGGKMRLRSAQNIFEEIQHVKNQFGIQDFRFIDDVFTVNRTILNDFCDRVIQSGEPIKWMCCGRVDLADSEVLEKMKRAGCYRIEYGIESGNSRLLEMVDKGATVEQSKTAIAKTKKAGIESIANFILGFPTETEAEMKETVDFALRLAPEYAIFFSYTPFVGTKMSDDFDLKWDPEMPGFRAPSEKYLVPTAQVLDRIDRAYSRFYFRPGYILKRLLAIRSGWILLDLAKMALAHLKSR